MKTAEEWTKDSHDYIKLDIPLCEDLSPKLVKQIQLDALKEGLRRAAKLNEGDGFTCSCSCLEDATKDILSAAEQLTEKDL